MSQKYLIVLVILLVIVAIVTTSKPNTITTTLKPNITTTTLKTSTTTTTLKTSTTTTTLKPSPDVTTPFVLQYGNNHGFYGWNSNTSTDAWASSNGDNNALVLHSNYAGWSFTFVNGKFMSLNGDGINPLYFKVDSSSGIVYFAPSSSDTFAWSNGTSIIHTATNKTLMYATPVRNDTTAFGDDVFALLCLSGSSRQLNTIVPAFSIQS
ncbi:MAG: hypothetical protein EOP45_09485 [Sphingobacteriaceae bacterium]|nr:MAG: hypothetical protein EOP45_09485 [Sphingobacteriaceae bacterium]